MMKNYKMKVLVVLSLFISSTSFSQWTIMGGGVTTGADFADMAVIDSNIIYIGGVNGYLKKTTDGTNWVNAKNGMPSLFDIYSIHCTDANTCFASGRDETGWEAFWTTIDGGSSWQTAPVPQDGFGDIFFLNSGTGYASNNGSNIYKTVNAGNSWQDVSPAQGFSFIDEMYFTSVDVGYVVGAIGTTTTYGKIMKTVDGGANWTTVFLSTTPQSKMFDITFVNSNIGFAVGYTGILLKTIDAGVNWAAIDLGSQATNVYLSVDFANQYSGVVYATGTSVRRTIDGGNTWTSETIPASGGKVSMPHKDKSFILGTSTGQLFESSVKGDLLTNGLEEIFKNNNISIYPNPFTDQALVKMDANVSASELHIMDVSGKEVKSIKLQGKETLIDRENLLSGFYFYQITVENQIVKSGKITIE